MKKRSNRTAVNNENINKINYFDTFTKFVSRESLMRPQRVSIS